MTTKWLDADQQRVWRAYIVGTTLLLERLDRDLHRAPDDPLLAELHDLVTGSTTRAPGPPAGRVVCPRFRFGDTVVRTVTVVATFQHAVDVTLDEVRVELVYPEDTEAEAFFRAAADVPAQRQADALVLSATPRRPLSVCGTLMPGRDEPALVGDHDDLGAVTQAQPRDVPRPGEHHEHHADVAAEPTADPDGPRDDAR